LTVLATFHYFAFSRVSLADLFFTAVVIALADVKALVELQIAFFTGRALAFFFTLHPVTLVDIVVANLKIGTMFITAAIGLANKIQAFEANAAMLIEFAGHPGTNPGLWIAYLQGPTLTIIFTSHNTLIIFTHFVVTTLTIIGTGIFLTGIVLAASIQRAIFIFQTFHRPASILLADLFFLALLVITAPRLAGAIEAYFALGTILVLTALVYLAAPILAPVSRWTLTDSSALGRLTDILPANQPLAAVLILGTFFRGTASQVTLLARAAITTTKTFRLATLAVLTDQTVAHETRAAFVALASRADTSAFTAARVAS